MNRGTVNRILCLVVTCVYLTAISASPALAQSSMVKVGEITVMEGDATVVRAGTSASKTLGLGDAVYQNDMITTGAGGRLRITFLDESIVSIASNTSMKVTEYVYDPQQQTRSSGLSLLWGKIKCLVNDLAGYKSKKFTVTTSTAVAGVRGTDFVVWAVNDRETQVAGFDNNVDVANARGVGTSVIVTPKTITKVEEGMSPTNPKAISAAVLGVLMEGFLAIDAAAAGAAGGGAAGTGGGGAGGGSTAGITYSQAALIAGGTLLAVGAVLAIASSSGDDDGGTTTTTTEHHSGGM